LELEKIKLFFVNIYTRHRKFINIIIYFLWAILLAFIIYNAWNSRNQLLPYLKAANSRRIPLVVLFYLLALTLATVNWAAIMHAFDQSLPLWTHVRIYLVTMVTRRLPGTIWYIGGRMVLYKQLGVSQLSTASASGVEIIVSFVADCILAAVFLPFGLDLSNYWLIPLMTVSLIGLTILHPSILSFLMEKIKRPLLSPIEWWRVIVWLVLRMALVLTGGVMIFQTILIFLPKSSDLLFLVLGARALSGAAGMLTYFLPSSFGTSDLTLLAMLSTMIPTSLSAVIAVLVRLYTSLFELIFGFLCYIILKKSPEFSNFTLKAPKDFRDQP
jgi:uncharacterized membrane protein YbhN (UPF0104 family)